MTEVDGSMKVLTNGKLYKIAGYRIPENYLHC
jgi:hypothetical protein